MKIQVQISWVGQSTISIACHWAFGRPNKGKHCRSHIMSPRKPLPHFSAPTPWKQTSVSSSLNLRKKAQGTDYKVDNLAGNVSFKISTKLSFKIFTKYFLPDFRSDAMTLLTSDSILILSFKNLTNSNQNTSRTTKQFLSHRSTISECFLS